MFGLLLAFAVEAGWMLLKQAGCFVFTWVSPCCSGKLCWLASLSRDVTGELNSLLLRCYGFGTVLDFFRWLAPR